MSKNNEQTENKPALLTIDVAKIAKKPSSVRITNKARLKFLQTYAETANFTKAALASGHQRPSFYFLKQTDERFRDALKAIDDAHLDKVEQCLMTVAIQPTREGFNDRKLLLQSKRRETYGNQLQIDAKHEHKHTVSIPELNQILQRANVQVMTDKKPIPIPIEGETVESA